MPTVVIDCFPERAQAYVADHAIIGVDVIRATTTAQTAVASGRRCFPVPSLEVAVPLAARLENPLLAGELGGSTPYGFDVTNSPAEIAARTDVERPMILLSTSGTRLLWESRGAEAVYAGSLRNVTAQSRRAAGHERVAVLGAGTRGHFREEDQLCCAWIAARLIDAGHEPGDARTSELVERWRDQPPSAFEVSDSVEYLRRTDQLRDLEFVLGHVDDLESVYCLADGELVERPADSRA